MGVVENIRHFLRLLHVGGDDLLESPRSEVIHIEFTSRCNLRCVFCDAGQPGYRGHDFDASMLDDAIKVLVGRRPRVVSVNGHGETTIYKNWHHHCRRMLDAGLPLHMTSNFSRKFSPDEINVLSRFHSLEISCDSSDPVLFAQLRRGADLEQVIENIRKIQAAASSHRRRPPNLSFSCVITDRNIMGLPQYVAFGAAQGVTHFNFCNLTKYPDVDGVAGAAHISELPEDELKRARRALTDAFAFLEARRIPFRVQQGLLDSVAHRLENDGPETGETVAGPRSEPRHSVPPTRVPSPLAADGADSLPASAQRTPARRYSAPRPTGLTRDCIDPWSFLLVQANQDVLPCCWHRPVYSLSPRQSLADVFNNSLIKKLRRRLLTGDLPADCLNCPTRGWTTCEALTQRVWHYMNPLRVGRRFRKPPKMTEEKWETLPLEYVQGWYDPETDLSVTDPDYRNWRWTDDEALCYFHNPGSAVTLKLHGCVNKAAVKDQRILIAAGPHVLDGFVPGTGIFYKEYVVTPQMMGKRRRVTLKIKTDQTFVPSLYDVASNDERRLGVRIFGLMAGYAPKKHSTG